MSSIITDRVNLFLSIFPTGGEEDVSPFLKHFTESNGNFAIAIEQWQKEEALKNVASESQISATAQQVRFVQALADVTDNDATIIQSIRNLQPEAQTLQAVALNFGLEGLTDLAAASADQASSRNSAQPGDAQGTLRTGTPILVQQTAISIRRKLFLAEPSAVVQRMLQDEEIKLSSPPTRDHIRNFLRSNPEFDIRQTSVTSAITKSPFLNSIPETDRPTVVSELKTLQRVQALTPVPEAIEPLMKSNLTSASHIAAIPQETFAAQFSTVLGDEVIATSIHQHAVESRVRNENFLISALQAVRGTGLRAIDGGAGKSGVELRKTAFEAVAGEMQVQVNLEQLFGSLDYCECSDCTSVYSPASYYVELLEFLRNSNLTPSNPNIGTKSIRGTQLEQLLLRRPDLKCIELTCENTNTLIPYIDLALEVMESYAVHAPQITAYNVRGETSNELLSQPQHTNEGAYEILRKEIYPLGLPYNFAIDTMRVYLSFLGSSRAELLNIFQSTALQSLTVLTPFQESTLRASNAEFNLIAQEEYVILTKEAFRNKDYYKIRKRRTVTDEEYAAEIQLREPWRYYGYEMEEDMLNSDTSKKGLTWVKAQFLKRSGILYTDLVDVLQTRFVNPRMPKGKALSTMDKIRFSYRFLQTLIAKKYSDPQRRYEMLVKFLSFAQPLIPLVEWAKKLDDPCTEDREDNDCDCGKGPGKTKACDHCCSTEHDWKCWVYNWFECIGRVIVLESGEGPSLPIEGRVWVESNQNSLRDESVAAPLSGNASVTSNTHRDPILLGSLTKDGGVVNDNGEPVAFVTVLGVVVDVATGKAITDSYENGRITIYSKDDLETRDVRGFVHSEDGTLWTYANANLMMRSPIRAQWSSTKDTCDIEKVRLIHLDGSRINPEEYDRIHRFLRLWKKMGWTIEETDDALQGLGKHSITVTSEYEESDDGRQTGEEQTSSVDISVSFIHQLVAVKKLLDLTAFPLPVLLSFWYDIPTKGEKSLYAKTFLTHNLVRMDPVFQADSDGVGSETITGHLPVLQAALRVTAEEIALIRQDRDIPDKLNLTNISALYRYVILGRYLQLKVEQLPKAIALFGKTDASGKATPFTDANVTLEFLETWGKMNESGFTFPQLDYIIRNTDTITRPIGPSEPQVLRLTKSIIDGLAEVDKQHPDVTQIDLDNQTVLLPELIPGKLALIYTPALATQINDLIAGRFVFKTNAPRGLSIKPPEGLAAKVKYFEEKDITAPKASLIVTGILTPDEEAATKGLSSNPNWMLAVDRIKKQGQTFYDRTLAGILSTAGAATMLKGDTADTAAEKGLYFLTKFLPFLRAQLATQIVETNVSDSLGLPPKISSYLLSEVVKIGDQSALSLLLALNAPPSEEDTGWKGYFISPSTGPITFIATAETMPNNIVIDRRSLGFPHRSEDPSDLWSTSPIKMVSGTLYLVELSDRPANQLQWQTPTSPAALISPGTLLPAPSSNSVRDVFVGLTKLSLIIDGFSLELDEIVHFHENGSNFGDGTIPLRLDSLSLNDWRRLEAYTSTRDQLPKMPTRLIDLFSWAATPDDTPVEEYIQKTTLWEPIKIKAILMGFGALHASNFKNEIVLMKLKTALEFTNKTQIDPVKLFEWAQPHSLSDSSYQKLRGFAEALKNALRARYNADDWEKVIRPLGDTLRKNQRDALVAHLVVHESLAGKVKDADSLFEYFLIDVQMNACMETSRIKQAISTVQLYIQRCLLGLEGEEVGQGNDRISRDRWNWMKRYRVWEANRKVYLYPENWIDPSLRDDKSPPFLDLESELQQNDTSLSNVTEAFKTYLLNVADVGNLKVYGLYVQLDPNDKNKKKGSIHVFARRKNAPYDYYSRIYTADGDWTPWVKLPVDIPNFEAEDSRGVILNTGTYLSPSTWQGLPILFFPQMIKKSIPYEDTNHRPLIERMNNDNADTGKPTAVWEIKLCWSIFRNGNWTPKQVSEAIIRDVAPTVTVKGLPGPYPNQSCYQTVVRSITENDLQIDVQFRERVFDTTNENAATSRKVGSFIFTDGQVSPFSTLSGGSGTGINTLFHYKDIEDSEGGLLSRSIYSLQATGPTDAPPYAGKEPRVDYPVTSNGSKIYLGDKDFVFNHTFINAMLSNNSLTSLDPLKDLFDKFSTLSAAATDDPFGSGVTTTFNELKSPYALYNWEIGLHAPMLLIDGLLKAQQFEDALNVSHLIFDPSAKGAGGNKKYWNFLPFKALADTDAKKSLEDMFLALKPQQSDTAITSWRGNPFSPHAIARLRPVAYMKWIAMRYIEILIAFGDYYFRQNSLETIPNAIQAYVVASHVYGPRGQKIPKRGKTKPETYASLLNRWDAFGNAVVQLEVAFPFSNQTPLPIGSSNGITGLANIFGFATSLYFCIPDNPKLRELRDTIDDRLYKIRNCMDINGVVRHLALFDPPIDPALLVLATAQGLNIDTVLNDLSGPLPNYRFQLLLGKAVEICAELKSLGAALLSAKEKKDGEKLQTLRASHESQINTLTLDIKSRMLDESNKTLDSLLYSRTLPLHKLQFYKTQIGLTDGAPSETTDFQEIPNATLKAPVLDGELLLIDSEKEEQDKALAALNWNIGIGVVETLAGLVHLVPDIGTDGKPFGVGLGISWGGTNLGHASGAVARGLQIYASYLSSSSSRAGRKASLLRAMQDRVLQANSTGMELKNIDKQITTQRIRISTAEQEVKNQESTIEQLKAVEEFLKTKYTNEELYSWMEGQSKAMYYQAYTLAFDLAKKAEKAFKFERPQNKQEYIKFGYWNGARDGLLAGEQLFLGLKHLEAAHQESLGHDFEMIKHVSVRQWAPLSILEFRETGSFELRIPEILFDMDCPGQYMRRITSVSVTIPCVLGPYTSVNCTLRLQEHSIRTSPRAAGKNDYPQITDGDDERFSILSCPITSVALSSGQNDMGRHDIQLTDRYNPFEGAGVISKWRFDLPADFRVFDYSTITDVIMHIRYTSLDGGDKLKQAASDTVMEYVKAMQETSSDRGLFALLDLKSEFAMEWYAAFNASNTTPVRELKLLNLQDRLPVFTKAWEAKDIVATSMALLGRGTLVAGDVNIVMQPEGSQSAEFKAGLNIKDLVGLTAEGFTMPMTNWKLSISGTSVDVERLWLVVKYTLKG